MPVSGPLVEQDTSTTVRKRGRYGLLKRLSGMYENDLREEKYLRKYVKTY